MDAVKYLKEKYRMTNNCCGSCMKCPLGNRNNRTKKACNEYEAENTEEAIAIVEQWAKEHPVKTYLSVLLERFPNVVLGGNGTPAICPHNLFGGEKWDKCDGSFFICDNCWNREYRED